MDYLSRMLPSFYLLYIFSYTLYRFRRSLKITSLHISVSIEAIQLPSYGVRHSPSDLQCQEGPLYVEFAPFVVKLMPPLGSVLLLRHEARDFALTMSNRVA